MKQKILDSIVPAILLAILGAALATWRDVAVMKVQIEHINKDVDLVQKFIVSDDPKVYTEARRQLAEDVGH